MSKPLRITTDRLRLILLRHLAPRVADEVIGELGEADEPEEPAPVDLESARAAAYRDYRRKGHSDG